ncbi:MAG: hypothetical protein KFH87_03705 [Bacteroidetes bacterium]|nr:hypothetical protein [Bacteroidota bacterium]
MSRTTTMLAVLLCLVAGTCRSGEAFPETDAEVTCILYTSIYDCISCRLAFIAYANAYNKRDNVRFLVALKTSRIEEYKKHLRTVADAHMYIRPDDEFSKRYAGIVSGDVLVLSGGVEVGRTSMYSNKWPFAMEELLDSITE